MYDYGAIFPFHMFTHLQCQMEHLLSQSHTSMNLCEELVLDIRVFQGSGKYICKEHAHWLCKRTSILLCSTLNWLECICPKSSKYHLEQLFYCQHQFRQIKKITIRLSMYFLTVFYYANIWAVLITLRRKLCQLTTPFPLLLHCSDPSSHSWQWW